MTQTQKTNIILSLRKKLNLSQSEFGKLIGMENPQISRLENGKSPSVKTLERIAMATNHSLIIEFKEN